ncbi:hypothetical protein [Micromonospora sp. NPDC048830]|uniref:hypothetical protein n=1 Tax=Micromonospora sp. NPDC048830 TaxID=3364257 RepID=UPI0037164E51
MTGTATGPHPARVTPTAEPGPPTNLPWLVGGGLAVVLLLLAPRYGYHRDELYFLLAGRHLDWGYVDRGPLVPALARLADTLAPGNLVALRTPSALVAAAAVAVSAAIAREFGAGRGAQLFAALLAAPTVLWQATHGFPQLDVASAISDRDSSYSGRLDALVLQFVIISPYVVPIWVAGLVALLRRPAWRAHRAVAWAWLVVAAVVLAGGWQRPDQLRRWFTDVTEAGRVDQRVGVDNDENRGPIWLCRGLRRPWADIWHTEVRHAG